MLKASGLKRPITAPIHDHKLAALVQQQQAQEAEQHTEPLYVF